MDELKIYKQNRINNLQKIYNEIIHKLRNSLQTNIRNVEFSRQIKKYKIIQINNLINQYNNNVKFLTNTLNSNISLTQKFTPVSPKITGTKKALLIGINYTGTYNQLFGCINDVNSVKERITNNGFTQINIMTDLTTKKANRQNILTEFTNLLIHTTPGDLLFFLYSGHGYYKRDLNGDEEDKRDELILPCDLLGITDDELKQIIDKNLKTGVTLFAMFDSCFSGTVLDLKYQYLNSMDYDKYTENSNQRETMGNVFMISGCSDNQQSADSVFDGKPNGAMTWSLLESLKENSSITWRELVKNMRELLKKSQYNQIPQFSCGNFQDIDTNVFI